MSFVEKGSHVIKPLEICSQPGEEGLCRFRRQQLEVDHAIGCIEILEGVGKTSRD